MAHARELTGGGQAGHRITVNGVDLAYQDWQWGAGPTVVCLHATGHGAGDFELLRDRVGDRYRLVALDWPGHGRSGDDAHPVGIDRYVELLQGFLSALQIETCVLLGCSIGGATAIRYAARYPERVSGMVLCDPGGLHGRNPLVALFCGMMARFFRAGARGAKWYPRAFRWYYGIVLPGRPARDQRERIIAGSRETAPVLAQAWNHFAEPGADVRGDAARVRCPVLFAWAKQDRVLPYWQCKRGVAAVPDRRVEFFPGGHAAFLEAPDAFAAALTAFVDDMGTRPPCTDPSATHAIGA